MYTGDVKNAVTDADVSIVLYGTLGDSGEFKLDDKKNNFEKGQYVYFFNLLKKELLFTL